MLNAYLSLRMNALSYTVLSYITKCYAGILLIALFSITTYTVPPFKDVLAFNQASSNSAQHMLLNENLQVVTALSLSPNSPIANEPVTASFSIKNVGGQEIELAKLLTAGRGDGCVDWSCTNYQQFESREDVAIAPGETIIYTQQKTFAAEGDYFAQISYQLPNGSWGFLGNRVDFVVSPKFVFDAPLAFTTMTPAVGESVSATFTIRNAGSQPATLLNIGVGGRGPNCVDWSGCTLSVDMPFDADITLLPGETYAYSAQRSYLDTGTYLARVGIKTIDGWSFIGTQTTFSVTSGLTVTTPLSIMPEQVYTNEFVTFSFTVKNQSNVVLSYDNIGVGGRGPDCTPLDWNCANMADISSVSPFTLNPGESWQYSARHFFPEAGDYFFQIWLKDIFGEWNRLDAPISITVAPTVYPARSAELQVGAGLAMTFDFDADTLILTKARDMGIDIVRIELLWRFLEPDFKGNWNEGWFIPNVDRTLNKANELGIEVYFMLREPPCWASADPNKNCSDPNGAQYDYAYPAQDHQDYADAFKKVIELYGDRVDTWEVWNEPNIDRFWHPSLSIADYTDMLKAIYSAIKSADPNATVLGGVIAGSNVNVLEQMYAAGAKGYFDALSIHPYTGEAPDECLNPDYAFLCGVEVIRATMLENNDPKPIWFSEFGWSSYTGEKGVGEALQRDYLAQALDIAGGWDYVPVVTWYLLMDRGIAFPDKPHEEYFGLYDANGQEKPVATWLRNRPKPDNALAITTPLGFTDNTPIQGDTVTASFDIRNNGSQPITLRQIGVIVRNDGCEPHLICTSYQDFPLEQNVTIAPNATYKYSQQYASTQSGSHFAQVVYESSIGEWFIKGTQASMDIAINSAATPTPITPTPITPTPITPTPVSGVTATPQVTATATQTSVSSITPTPTATPTVLPGTSTAPPTVSPQAGDIFLPMLLK